MLDATNYDHPNTVLTIDGNPLSLHRPGFRPDPAATARQRVADAYAAYDREITSAYKTRDAEDYGEHQIGQSCTVRGRDYPQNSGDLGRVERLDDGRIVCAPIRRQGRGGPRGKDTATIARDHQQTLGELYAQRDAELAQAWRGGK
jgi:hypothetical protein